MFDIGFSELIVIAVIALIVLGPEKLPRVARTMGHLFGRMQRYVNDVKADINRELELDELKKLQASVQDTARSLEQSVAKEMQSVEADMNQVARDAGAAVAEPQAATEAPAPPDAAATPAATQKPA